MLTLEQKNNNEIRFMELLSRLNIDLTEINKMLDKIALQSCKNMLV